MGPGGGRQGFAHSAHRLAKLSGAVGRGDKAGFIGRRGKIDPGAQEGVKKGRIGFWIGRGRGLKIHHRSWF